MADVFARAPPSRSRTSPNPTAKPSPTARPQPPPTPEQPEPPRAASPQPPTHPELDKAALHGPAGRIVSSLAPHTEAHPAALLLQFLAAFGNLIGPGPHCMVESTRHAPNLFVILVGDSSKGRKGTSLNLIANLFTGVDPSWLSTRVNSARLTANGLVQALRDQQPPTDRRRLALSEEFAPVVHSLKRGNGHLSPLLRCAWNNGNLPTSTCTTNCAPPAPTSASSRISPSDDLDFLFSPSSFNFNFDESVTYMPGTFCYRHARPHKGDTSTALEAAEGTRTSKH